MFTLAFLKSLGERALMTFAGSLGGFIGGTSTGLLDAPWVDGFSVAGMATILVALASVAAGKITTSNSPSFTSEKTDKELTA